MKYKNWDDFKIHCSSIHNIMGMPVGLKAMTEKQLELYDDLSNREELTSSQQDKLSALQRKIDRLNDPELSSAAKKILLGRYAFEKYNSRIAYASSTVFSPTKKGNELELSGIKLLSEIDKIDYVKQTEIGSNEYLRGYCDIICPKTEMIIDIKVMWNINTFFTSQSSNLLDKKYWYQMQGYLDIYEKKFGKVCMVLLNTPAHLIDQEKAKLMNKYLMGEIDKDKYNEDYEKLEMSFDYEGKIPSRRRVLTYNVERCKEAMLPVYKKVVRCREWLNEFEQKHLSNKKIVTSFSDYKIPTIDQEEDYT